MFEQGGRSKVWKLELASLAVRAQPATVAGADGNLLLIGAGLAVGDEVVTAGVHAQTEGQKVRRYLPPGAGSPAPVAASALASR